MTEFNLYVLVLCLTVFVLLAAAFSTMIAIIFRQSVRLIRAGEEDERIRKENSPEQKRRSRFISSLNRYVSVVVCSLLIICFLLSLFCTLTEHDLYASKLPSLRVVKSSSMASRDEKNKYLFDNELVDQLQVFDLILTHKMPPEEELRLYDVVVYEVEGEYIIHRIVGIEEPNEKHPDQRYFLLQGDAVRFPDKFPVRYEQMIGIYRGERLAAVGSFIAFIQSPAGYLCFILTLFVLIVLPIIERRLAEEEERRFIKISEPRLLTVLENGRQVRVFHYVK